MKELSKLDTYRNSLNSSQQIVFDILRKLIRKANPEVCETIFVRQPYFYLSEYESIKFHTRPSIMLSFFGDHVNVFALANAQYESRLKSYHFTEKHNMQIKLDQTIEEDTLVSLFRDSLKK